MKFLSIVLGSILLASCASPTTNLDSKSSSAELSNVITSERLNSDNHLVIDVSFDYQISNFKPDANKYTCTLDLLLKDQGSFSLAKTDEGICYLNSKRGRLSVSFTNPVQTMNADIAKLKSFLPEINTTLKSPLEYHLAISEQVDENKFIKIAHTKNKIVAKKI